jgi:PIN domain nuclease of toxin-antitoxin system
MEVLLDAHALIWFINGDPFDRIIISQGLVEKLTIYLFGI